MHGGETHAPEIHAHDHVAPPRRREAEVSLLRLSAGRRIAITLGAVVLIWCGVYWALS